MKWHVRRRTGRMPCPNAIGQRKGASLSSQKVRIRKSSKGGSCEWHRNSPWRHREPRAVWSKG
eukprot:6373261-Heterocapsa_arctica.AAC.1